MRNDQEVNTGVGSSDDVLRRIQVSMPTKFAIGQWQGGDEAGLASCEKFDPNSVDHYIMQAIQQKALIMLVPTPGKEVTYSVYEFKVGNPFGALNAMTSLTEAHPFERAKEIINHNVSGGGREIMVLCPHPLRKTVDVYTLAEQKKPEDTQIMDTLSGIPTNVGTILGHGAGHPSDHDRTGHSSDVRFIPEIPQAHRRDQKINIKGSELLIPQKDIRNDKGPLISQKDIRNNESQLNYPLNRELIEPIPKDTRFITENP